MIDRELLELAAKAAGIGIKPMEMKNVSEPGDDRFIGFIADPVQCPRGWFNPLSDDGDALRLAVQLRIGLHHGNDEDVMVTTYDLSAVFTEKCGNDPYAATRRAIVRAAAAAEIGKAMK